MVPVYTNYMLDSLLGAREKQAFSRFFSVSNMPVFYHICLSLSRQLIINCCFSINSTSPFHPTIIPMTL